MQKGLELLDVYCMQRTGDDIDETGRRQGEMETIATLRDSSDGNATFFRLRRHTD